MSKSDKTFRIMLFVIALLGAICMVYPLLWMVASSFKPESLIFKDQSLFISQFTLENYTRGLEGIGGIPFWQYMLNSLKIIVPVVVGNLLSCSMVGFAMSRLKFPFKNVVYALIFLSMMLPLHATLIPRYILFQKLGWLETYLPMTVPSFFAVQGFFCYLFIQFMRGIPSELDQAATMDGCGPFRIYWQIILPLSVPAILTAAIFSFIWTYNDFFSQLVYISKPARFTIVLALRQYIDALELSAFGVLFAMSTLSLVPIFILFILCQRYLVEGIATTGLKG